MRVSAIQRPGDEEGRTNMSCMVGYPDVSLSPTGCLRVFFILAHVATGFHPERLRVVSALAASGSYITKACALL